MSAIKRKSIIGDLSNENGGNYSLDKTKQSETKANSIRDYGKTGPKIGVRHVQMLLMFLCLTIGFAMRTSLSVAIVAMTDKNTSPNPDIQTYDWNNTSIILSSFFWGYICLQVVAGYCGNAYGPKYFLLPAYFINSISFLLIPLAASTFQSTGVMICRVIQGLSQGFLYPSGHTMLGKWAPVEERSRMGILVYSGVSCGSILSSIITGYISASWVGWPGTFYIFGSLGVGWCVLYLIFGHNSPATHPSISPEERKYIETSLGQSEDVDIPVPWKSILTCVHLWAIVLANIGTAWGYTMTMTQIPTYLAKVKKFNIQSNGLVSAVPYMAGTMFGYIYAPISDHLIAKGYMRTVNVRRLFQLYGSYGLLCCLLILAYVKTGQATAVIVLAAGNVAYSATLVAYSVNHIDLSPRFSGIMQGISNSTSQAIAIFSPLVVQFVVTDQEDATQWRTVFVIAAVLYFVCATLYVIFASATRQKWDGPLSEDSARTIEIFKRQSIISLSGY